MCKDIGEEQNTYCPLQGKGNNKEHKENCPDQETSLNIIRPG